MVNAKWLYDRAHYLVRVWHCKNLITSTDKCVGPSWRPKSKLKIWGCSRRSPMSVKFAVNKSYNHDSIVTPLIAKKPKMQCQQKCEETKSTTKQSMSENKVLSDK